MKEGLVMSPDDSVNWENPDEKSPKTELKLEKQPSIQSSKLKDTHQIQKKVVSSEKIDEGFDIFLRFLKEVHKP